MNIARLSLFAITLVLGLPSLASAASDNGTLQIGHNPAGNWPCSLHIGSLLSSGYAASFFGSYSPTGLTGGRVVQQLADFVQCASPVTSIQTSLVVTGFSSNPGTAWLTSVTCGTQTKLRTAASYSYSSGTGQATWTWGSQNFSFWSPMAGTNVLCTIVHS